MSEQIDYPNLIVRTSNAKPEGGNEGDIQMSYRVQLIDADTGAVLAQDDLWESQAGINNDPDAARVSSLAKAQKWAATVYAHKLVELQSVKPLVDAINATSDVTLTGAELKEIATMDESAIKSAVETNLGTAKAGELAMGRAVLSKD